MVRGKTLPKKSTPATLCASIKDDGYIPVVKKRKVRRKIKTNFVIILLPNEKNKQFHLGHLLIGTTMGNDVIPDHYNKCKITVHNPMPNDEVDNIMMVFNESTIALVRLTIDTQFFIELCKAKVFALYFKAKNEEVYMDICFVTLPLPKFYNRIGNCVKTIFKLMYSIQTDTASEIATLKCDENLHGNTDIVNLYKKISAIRENKLNLSANENVQHICLKPKLRLYQEKAVKWMLYRERLADSKSDLLHPLYTSVVLKSGLNIYIDKYTGHINVEKPLVHSSERGGILADEMGLGKTVEVLACILLNKKPIGARQTTKSNSKIVSHVDPEELKKCPVIDKQRKKRKIVDNTTSDDIILPKKIRLPNDWVKSSKKKSSTYVALHMWYSNILTNMSTTQTSPRQDDDPMVQCICGSTSDEGIIECDSCGKYQHGTCLGHTRSLGRYLCPQCWMDEPLLECRGTLIVTPLALRSQWCNEICRHLTGGLKVLQYEGYSASPVYPTRLKDYDLVITTYNVLKSELRLTESGQTVNLRRERKYSPPGSPLVRVKWWRLCLDEAQTVEIPGRMVSEMANKIYAHIRWAITGTPVSKNISDLYGLISYLHLTPFDDFATWKNILYDPYMLGNEQPMLNFLSDVLWRTSKIDVLDQINIPKQTYKEHLLEFSAVEKYFYRREHELSSSDFLFRVHNYDPTMLLEKMDKGALKKIMAPLLTLRHACTHPNTQRGRYLATKKKLTSMKDLLDALILKNTSDSEECLRLVISSLNGLAGIQLLLRNEQKAIEHYREALQLAARFSQDNSETKLTIDKLQVIHAMYNLAEVLDTCPPSQPTLRDANLRADCTDLEQKYMEKFMKETYTSYEGSTTAAATVEHLQEKFILNQGQWYSDGLEWIFIKGFFGDLLERIDSGCDRAGLECNLRNTSERNLLQIVYSWDESIFDLRLQLLEAIRKLYDLEGDSKIIIQEDLVKSVMNCHLRPQKKSKGVSKCPICTSNAHLKRYEGKLFNMTERKKVFEDMSLMGSWKPTLEEVIFRSTVSLLKAKNADINYIKDGGNHIAVIEALKKEFKEIRKMWTFLDQQICAQDELCICKVRLQLRDPSIENEENKASKVMKKLTYNVENKNETVNLIGLHELDYQNSLLASEVNRNTEQLEKSLGTQSYLGTLRKQQYEGQSPDPCPICKNTLEHHWSILLCGHSYCLDCIHVLLEQIVGEHIQCSVCRNKQKLQEISYIKSGNTVTDEDCSNIKGNYSTKIEAVIKLLLELKSDNPKVKVLIFSSWATVLKRLNEALQKNDVSCELALSTNLEEKIQNFKDVKKKITAFLLPISLGSKGLNLVEATHVILVEPLLNPADELQAVGRVHRIGQKQPTVVHKFLIKNTIEERIYQSTTSNADSWDKNKVTLQQLTDLFVSRVAEQEINNIETSQDSLNATDILNEELSSTA